jgi:hypothetical protein
MSDIASDYEGLSEDELTELYESSKIRSDEDATEHQARTAREANAAKDVAAKRRAGAAELEATLDTEPETPPVKATAAKGPAATAGTDAS